MENHLEVPKPLQVHVTVSDQENHAVLEKDMTISVEGTLAGDVELRANASLGYYTIRIGSADDGVVGSFRVEEYRKPEYQVRVSAAKPRLLQGDKMQVTIDSRYFFGEPVANAVVKYKVFHAPHYWWGDEDDETNPWMGAAEDTDEATDDSVGYGADQVSAQTGKLDANGKLTITVQTSVENSTGRWTGTTPLKLGSQTRPTVRELGVDAFCGLWEFPDPCRTGELFGPAGLPGDVQCNGGGYDHHPV